MNIKTLNVSLLSISIITALFPLNAMATKLTIEQRLELLELELESVTKKDTDNMARNVRDAFTGLFSDTRQTLRQPGTF